MTTSLKIENFRIAKEHFTWLSDANQISAFIFHSFKSYNPLDQKIISNIGALLLEKALELDGRPESFYLLIRRLNTGTKIDKYKGIWKLDFFKNDFIKNAKKNECEISLKESIFNFGIIELPIAYLDFGLMSLVQFPKWSFIFFNISEDLLSIPLSNWLTPQIISNNEEDNVLDILINHPILKNGNFIRFGDGGDDWEFALLHG